MRAFLGCMLMILVCFTGCARVPRPLLAPQQITGVEKEGLLKAIGAQDAALQSFKGLARGVLDEAGERAIVRYVILFKRPESLRIEALPSTGAYTLSILAANPDGVVMVDPVNRRGYRSTDPAHALKTALRIPIPPRDLASYLLGLVPQGALHEALDVRSSPDGIQIVAGDFESYWLLDPKSLRLKRVELRRAPHARPSLSIEYGEYAPQGAWRYPLELRLEVPGESLIGSISFRSAEFNPTISDVPFNLAIPADYAVYTGADRSR